MANNPYLSVIIPTYDEEKRIGETLDKIVAYLSKQSYAYEILLSDDGSTDQTLGVAGQKLREAPHQILQAPRNEGKGSAVKRGMLQAKGERLLFSDADLSTPIEEIERFLKYHDEGYDVVIGSRALNHSNVEVRQDATREGMGRIYNAFARIFAFQDIQDSQCGFKSFTRKAARDLFSRQKILGFSFDAELLFLAQRFGYKIREEPVTWRNSAQSRVRLFQDPLCMFWELLKIRWLHRKP